MRQHSLGTEGKTGNVIQHSCQALLLQDNDIVLLSLKRQNWMLPDELGTTCPTRASQYVPFYEALPRLEQFAGFVIFRQITLLEMLWMPMDGLYFQDQHLIVWGSYMNNLGKYLLTLMTLCIRTQKWEEWMQLQQQAEIGLLTFVYIR